MVEEGTGKNHLCLFLRMKEIEDSNEGLRFVKIMPLRNLVEQYGAEKRYIFITTQESMVEGKVLALICLNIL